MLLPIQLSCGAPALMPERQLLWAVLEQALADLRSTPAVILTRRSRAARLAREARAWFESGERRWPFSFENVCAGLGLEPDAIRQALARSPVGLGAPWRRRDGQALGPPAATGG